MLTKERIDVQSVIIMNDAVETDRETYWRGFASTGLWMALMGIATRRTKAENLPLEDLGDDICSRRIQFPE